MVTKHSHVIAKTVIILINQPNIKKKHGIFQIVEYYSEIWGK